VCQALTHAADRNTYTASRNVVDANARSGWYVDLPADTRLNNGRIIGRPTLTPRGTLTFTANVPTNVPCDPGGSSWFFAIDGASGGAVSSVLGGDVFRDAGYFLGFALASRPVIVETPQGRRALIRMSDKGVQNPEIPETQAVNVQWRRVYWRAVR
jgi:type IV pilus assembly protein PilY1